MPGAPKNPRKKKLKTHPAKARCGQQNGMWQAWNDPVTRPILLARLRAAKGGGRPAGVADGYTKEQIAALRVEAEAKAERIIKLMAQHDDDLDIEGLTAAEAALVTDVKWSAEAEALVDDDKAIARRAMKEAITVCIMPGNTQTKLQAARTLLEWTKTKPASTTTPTSVVPRHSSKPWPVKSNGDPYFGDP